MEWNTQEVKFLKKKITAGSPESPGISKILVFLGSYLSTV
jgi:hypothetical protein